MEIREQKNRLRQEMIRQREKLTPQECLQAAAGLRVQLLGLFARLGWQGRALKLAVYAAMRQELDLAPVWPDLLAWPADLYFPAVQGRGDTSGLVFGKLPAGVLPGDFLVTGHFGVAEPPVESRQPELPDLDAILLPGLAFDRLGNRLGWGRAYYDRFLAALHNQPVLIGICYSFQIQPGLLPTGTHDRPVDWLATPETILQAPGS